MSDIEKGNCRPINSSFGVAGQTRQQTRAISLQSTLLKISRKYDDVADVTGGDTPLAGGRFVREVKEQCACTLAGGNLSKTTR